MSKKNKEAEQKEELVDVGRAAELLGYSYNAITRAIESGALSASASFERKGGTRSPLIRKGDLESYRQVLIRRYETMPHGADRLAELQERKVYA